MDWLELWYQALNSRIGIVVQVSDVTGAQQKLYRVRASSGDPELLSLTIRVSPVNPRTELWIFKNGQGQEREE